MLHKGALTPTDKSQLRVQHRKNTKQIRYKIKNKSFLVAATMYTLLVTNVVFVTPWSSDQGRLSGYKPAPLVKQSLVFIFRYFVK